MRVWTLTKGLFLLLILAARCYAQNLVPLLTFDTVILEDGTKIELHALSPTPISRDAIDVVEALSETPDFQLWRGRSVCEYSEQGALFRYQLFIKQKTPEQWYCVQINEVPYGQFKDCYKFVRYTISCGPTQESDQVHLPLHSDSNAQFLEPILLQGKDEVPISNGPLSIRLGSEWPILRLKNTLEDMRLIIHSVQLSNIQPALWVSGDKGIRLDYKNEELEIGEAEKKSIDDVRVRARPMAVLPITFFRLKGGEDTLLRLTVDYETIGGGKPKTLAADIKVRFVPSLPLLFLAALGGGMIGSVVRLVEKKTRSSKAWLASLPTAIITAVVLEFMGVVLAGANTEFKIFGLVLDPFQFPQVLFMAMLVGFFAINLTDALKQVLPFFRGAVPPAKP